jgi:hypothetical protein
MKLIPKYSEKVLKTQFFGIFLNMADFWILVDFLTTDFHSSKSCFFLVFTHPGLIHCEKPKIQPCRPKPKGPGFESRIRQGYRCVMNVSPCGYEVTGNAHSRFQKNLITN